MVKYTRSTARKIFGNFTTHWNGKKISSWLFAPLRNHPSQRLSHHLILQQLKPPQLQHLSQQHHQQQQLLLLASLNFVSISLLSLPLLSLLLFQLPSPKLNRQCQYRRQHQHQRQHQQLKLLHRIHSMFACDRSLHVLLQNPLLILRP